jgi:hypothetical protein
MLLLESLWWASHTPPQSHTALPTPYSTMQIAGRVSYGVVCMPSAAARAAMGHWGQYPHAPWRWKDITWGGPHTPPCKALDQTRRSGHHIRPFELRFGCRTVVRTSSSAARATMGTVGNVPIPQGWQDIAWSPWGSTVKLQSNTTKPRRCQHRI